MSSISAACSLASAFSVPCRKIRSSTHFFDIPAHSRGSHLFQHGFIGDLKAHACIVHDPGCQGVEGADFNPLALAFSTTPVEPLPDLLCSLVGEGDGQDRCFTLVHEPPDALHQDTGLARARPGN